jgi:hypothetical protein
MRLPHAFRADEDPAGLSRVPRSTTWCPDTAYTAHEDARTASLRFHPGCAGAVPVAKAASRSRFTRALDSKRSVADPQQLIRSLTLEGVCHILAPMRLLQFPLSAQPLIQL